MTRPTLLTEEEIYAQIAKEFGDWAAQGFSPEVRDLIPFSRRIEAAVLKKWADRADNKMVIHDAMAGISGPIPMVGDLSADMRRAAAEAEKEAEG